MGRRQRNKRPPPSTSTNSTTNSSSLSSSPSIDTPDLTSFTSFPPAPGVEKSPPPTLPPFPQSLLCVTPSSHAPPRYSPSNNRHAPYKSTSTPPPCSCCQHVDDYAYSIPKIVMPHPFLRPDKTNAINDKGWLAMVSQALPTDIAFIGAVILTEHWLGYEVLPHELWVCLFHISGR